MTEKASPGGNTTTAGAVEMARRIAWETVLRVEGTTRENMERAALAAIIETTEAEDRRIVAWLKSEYASSSASGEIPVNAVSMIDTIRRLIEEGAHRQ